MAIAGEGRRAGAPAQRRPSPLLHPAAKPLLAALCLLPLVWLVYAVWADRLGVNPAETLIRSSGEWTLRFVCATLAVSPLRQWLGLPALLRFRRMLGLFAFTYGVLHFLSYAWLDQGFELEAIVRDIVKRPFILMGSTALLLMLPLAITSFNRAIKALGARRWQRLHRLVYAVVVVGLLHFVWMRSSKQNYGDVLPYVPVIAVLLGWRVRRWAKARRAVN